MNKFKRLAILGSAALLPLSAFAAEDAGLTAINNIPDQVAPYGYALVAVGAGMLVFKYIRRLVG
ncbi:hypothetical protein [Snodgrassella communis]|uniref:Phage coat protein n=1 Tax=Snodgrassella alvi TaxID=1196083 RepID=A0A2N9XVZ2_9NEIS|nr:hypothetical protein [Snodgrassella communis]PIT50639.1 hypothetical protein BHC48_05905 [Snodgrassella communis]PIT50646.1 hypothetical protein BHC48_05870 [Snodgrassella communis]PIT53732.1 hypothetical protein BHC48_01075 [Snodgrassella communis]